MQAAGVRVRRCELTALLASLVVLAPAPPALGDGRCGTAAYSYAGLSSATIAAGVSAEISVLHASTPETGHVAAWVGVGGEGLGPGATNEWLQAGISVTASAGPALYYELAQPGAAPQYVVLAAHIPVGRAYRIAVVESRARPGTWSVWVNGLPATGNLRLPGSNGTFAPIATAESWSGDASTVACDALDFELAHVRVIPQAGRSWHRMRSEILDDAGYRVEPRRDGVVAVGGQNGEGPGSLPDPSRSVDPSRASR